MGAALDERFRGLTRAKGKSACLGDGLLEIAGAILVLVPCAAFVGPRLLTWIMVGALFSHLTHGQVAMATVLAVLLVIALVVGTLAGGVQIAEPVSPESDFL